MSDEAGVGGTAPATVGVAPGAALTAGAMLRAAREKAGLHIGSLAVSLKVPVKKLEALEADRIDLLPDAVFARALTASVCRTLKLDPAPFLLLLPQQVTPPLQLEARTGNTSYSVSGSGLRWPMFSGLPRAVVVSAGLLLLAAGALWLLAPSSEQAKPVRAADGDATAAIAAASLPPAVVAPVVSVPVLEASASVAPSAVPALAASAASPAVAAAAAQKTEAAVDAAAAVVFRASAPSWIEVTDAGGTVQLRKTMAAAETASASGKLPLSVVIGRADAVEVLVRGQAMNLAPVAKDNVARFQIK